jgi:hypothetical protein
MPDPDVALAGLPMASRDTISGHRFSD